jgi:nitrogen fixation protein FixH
MKINWGTGIILAFIGFISFILFFIIRMSTDDRANHDLVTEGYYKAELTYQNDMDAAANAEALSEKVQLHRIGEGILIQFPKEMDYSKINGMVSLYRPSDKLLDFEIPVNLSNSQLLIPTQRLQPGRWDVRVSFTYEGKPFLLKKSMTYNEKQDQ